MATIKYIAVCRGHTHTGGQILWTLPGRHTLPAVEQVRDFWRHRLSSLWPREGHTLIAYHTAAYRKKTTPVQAIHSASIAYAT